MSKPKMIKVHWHVEMGFVGCEHSGVIEVEEDCSTEAIDEAVRDEVFNVVSWGWEKEEKEADDDA